MNARMVVFIKESEKMINVVVMESIKIKTEIIFKDFGKRISKMVKAKQFLQMAFFIKVDGMMTKSMAMEFTKLLSQNIQENEKMIKSMVKDKNNGMMNLVIKVPINAIKGMEEEFINEKIKAITKEISLKIPCMEEERENEMIRENMKAAFLKIKCMDKENLPGQMENIMKGIMLMTKRREKEN